MRRIKSGTSLKTVALIGAGQVGSRHLQALAKCDFPIRIAVVEPNENARKVALERLEQVSRSPVVEQVDFVSESELPPSVDLAVIATNSNDRLAVLKSLLERNPPKNLILEKVLFTSLDELSEADSLLARSTAKAWVNCPKRTYPRMEKIREMLGARPFRLEVRGSNWGLACNSIHFVDLVAYLTRETSFTVDIRKLDPVIHDSKRKGYVEFTGTLKASFRNGTELSLTSGSEGAPSFQTLLVQDDLQIDLNDNVPQSELTQHFCRQILMEGRCDLPSFEESSQLHRPLLAALLEHYSLLRGKPERHVPIT